MKVLMKSVSIGLLILSMILALTLTQRTTLTQAATTFTVTNTSDSGPGSFQQAILDANSDPGPDVISFAVAGCGPGTTSVCSITPATPLADITESVAMNGALSDGNPGLEKDGGGAGGVLGGLILKNHTGSIIEGMIVNGFRPIAGLVNGGNGLLIDGGGSHTVRNAYFGTDSTGGIAKGNQGEGIHLLSSSNNIIEYNIVSGDWKAVSKFASQMTIRCGLIGLAQT